jgi:CHAD domain-containing protein
MNRQINKRAGSKKEIICLTRYLDDQISAFKKLLKNVSQNPETEQVHKLRVTTRKLRTILWVLRDSSDIGSTKKISRHLQDLCKELGRQREIDTLVEDGTQFHLKTSHLRRKQTLIQLEVRNVANRKRYRKLSSKLKRVARKFQDHPALRWEDTTGRLQAKLKPWLHCHLESGDDFHELRKTMKTIRYSLSGFGHLDSKLLKLCELLGRVHDLAVLQRNYKTISRIKQDRRLIQAKVERFLRPALQSAQAEISRLH